MTLLHLHDCPVDDDEVLRRRLHRAALAGVARVEEERRPLQADPVALPAALARQLNLDRGEGEKEALGVRNCKGISVPRETKEGGS